jgi:hypothetical protein
MKIYRIEGSSYDGCNGWSHWYTDDIYIEKEAADKACAVLEKRNQYGRYKVVESETK